MVPPYADLRLYYGLCQSRGHAERDTFRDAPASEVTEAREHIEEMLLLNMEETGAPSYVHDERHALEVLGRLQESFPNAYGVIQPLRCKDGKLQFNRKIRFQGLLPQDQPRLQDTLCTHVRSYHGQDRYFLVLQGLTYRLEEAVAEFLQKELVLNPGD